MAAAAAAAAAVAAAAAREYTLMHEYGSTWPEAQAEDA